MKRNLTSFATSHHAPSAGATADALVDPAHVAGRAGSLAEALEARPRLTVARTPVWKHRLIVTGNLDHRSAAELDDEIECLCQEGVTVLTLDLRQLDAIDSAGARVIAIRGALCTGRGNDFSVIAESPVVRRALTEAGAADLLNPDSSETVVRRFPSRPTNGSHPARSTTMIKSL
jgi:anti-anti-sigma factor